MELQSPRTPSPSQGTRAPLEEEKIFVVDQAASEDLAAMFSSPEDKSRRDPSGDEHGSPSDRKDSAAPGKARSMRLPRNLSARLLVSAAVVIGLGAVALGVSLRPSAENAAKTTTAPLPPRVVHPVSLPEHQEDVTFLFSAHSVERTDLLTMTLKIRLVGPGTAEALKDLSVALRQEIYDYLMRQTPNKNAYRDWGRIVEGPLLAYLKDRFPKMGIASLALVDLQRI